MAIKLPRPGTGCTVATHEALATLAHRGFDPPDFGFLVWNYDPEDIVGPAQEGRVSSGIVRMMRLPRLTQDKTFRNVWFHLGTLAEGAVPGQSFAGIYSLWGDLLVQTADISADLVGTTGTGVRSFPLTDPFAAKADRDYVVAFLCNATVSPHLSAKSSHSASAGNPGQSPETARYADGPVARQTLPDSVDMTARWTLPTRPWVAVS